MNVFTIPESLYSKYHGSGYGLVATVNGQIVDLKYFEDIDDDLYIDSDAEVVTDTLKTIITDPKLSETVRYMQSLGNLHVGIFSCYEFVEL